MSAVRSAGTKAGGKAIGRGKAARARRDTIRVLNAAASPVTAMHDGEETVLTREGRRTRASATLVRTLLRGGALREHAGSLVRTEAGTAMLRRLLSDTGAGSDGAHGAQQRLPVPGTAEIDGAPEPVVRNALESPLDRLAAARERDGSPFLTPELAEAGRRLRSDFERGAMRARITMAWEAPASTGSGARGAPGVLTDTAMAARERYARAVEALGPRLGPALADFVAHEIGLTDVEKGRGWPARSGKMMLREALDRLAAHYRRG